MAKRSDAHPLLSDFPALCTIPVQWGELDAYGHVNNTVFFRYFETARIEYLGLIGFLDTFDRDRVGAILHSTSCRFRRPLHHPDTIQVGGRTVDVQDDRFTMEYRVVSLTHDEVVAEGQGVIVSFDYGRRIKVQLPDAVRARIRGLEGVPG